MQPELASAVDMQIALVDVQRRVQGRVPLPWIQADAEWLRSQQREGRPLVRFGDIPLEWSDFRLTLRQTADILRRFDALEPADHQQILAIGRDTALETLVSVWYNSANPGSPAAEGLTPGLEQGSCSRFVRFSRGAPKP